jgi:hypothetical protein
MELNTTPTPIEKPFTTNIFAEPIAQGRPRTRYWLIGDKPSNDTGTLMVEVLSKPEKAAHLTRSATELGLHFGVVHDTNGTDWQILEAQGSREAVEAFCAAIDLLHIRRAV